MKTKEEITKHIEDSFESRESARVELTGEDKDTATQVIKERLRLLAENYKHGDVLVCNFSPIGSDSNELIVAASNHALAYLIGEMMAQYEIPPQIILMAAMKSAAQRSFGRREENNG